MIKIQKDKNGFFIILSKEEVANILSSVDNIKQKAILMPVYSIGLRAGEVVRLKTEDIDSKRMLIHIIGPKGGKESGTDLQYIQELLGHKNSKTTRIYTHVSTQSPGKIKSPLDNIDLKEGRCGLKGIGKYRNSSISAKVRIYETGSSTTPKLEVYTNTFRL